LTPAALHVLRSVPEKKLNVRKKRRRKEKTKRKGRRRKKKKKKMENFPN
jgi:hypothetical protein